LESIFFDSQVTYDEYGTPVYDRPNSAEQLRATFASLLSNGIVSTRTSSMASEVGFIVDAVGGMEVAVNKGVCWINGSCGKESSRRTFTLDAGMEQPRYDSVVLRWDNRQAARNIDIFVKKGIPGGDPTIPLLERNSSVYELRLANILVQANTSAVTTKNITDTRLATEDCGLVVGLVKNIDTSQLYKQIQSDLYDFKSTEQAEFMRWFETIQNILDENVAGNLQKQIDTKVPMSRTINGKALTGNITLTVDDIGTSTIFLVSHPVGSLFETTVSTNPGTLYGGTWAAWGGGRTPVGVNPADTDFKTVEKTGGEKTHTLTVDEIAPHSHIETIYWNAGGSGTAHPAAVEAGDPRKYGGLVARTENTGGGQAHNNLQPYITCYIWKRTT
jgi:hypothetical protein